MAIGKIFELLALRIVRFQYSDFNAEETAQQIFRINIYICECLCVAKILVSDGEQCNHESPLLDLCLNPWQLTQKVLSTHDTRNIKVKNVGISDQLNRFLKHYCSYCMLCNPMERPKTVTSACFMPQTIFLVKKIKLTSQKSLQSYLVM